MDDAYFARPFVELDEWHDEPVPHRYVHGGFENTETQFSLYLPPTEQYEGRFLHHIEGGGGGTPRAQPGDIALACAYGGYLVVSNQGHMGPDATHLDREIHHYGASVASARHARTVAAEMYGDEPHHGYIWGGSGGAGRTIAILEHAPDLYDGAVVYILPHVAQQVLCAAVANAARVLGDALEQVIDATAPGGSGDPFAGLTSEQREALGAVTNSGSRAARKTRSTRCRSRSTAWYPDSSTSIPATSTTSGACPATRAPRRASATPVIQSTHTARRILTAAEVVASPAIDAMDPYQYLAVAGIARTRPEMPIGVVVDGLSARDAVGAWLTIQSGAAAGRELISLGGGGDVIVAAGGRRNMSVGFEDVAIGDEIAFDNSHYLAYSHFTRHQHEEYPEFDTFTVDGAPIYPQRRARPAHPTSISSRRTVARSTPSASSYRTCTTVSAGRAEPRTCAGCSSSDEDRHATYACGSPSTPCICRRPHCGPGRAPVASTRLIDYGGHVQQAIRDVIDWVERDKEPPADTAFDRSDDGAIALARRRDPTRRHPARRALDRERFGASGGARRRDRSTPSRDRGTARGRPDRRRGVGLRRFRSLARLRGRHRRSAEADGRRPRTRPTTYPGPTSPVSA